MLTGILAFADAVLFEYQHFRVEEISHRLLKGLWLATAMVAVASLRMTLNVAGVW